jgi:hypothetical protein
MLRPPPEIRPRLRLYEPRSDITIFNHDLDPKRSHARSMVRFNGSVIGEVFR